MSATSKYRNRKIEVDGLTFDSEGEAQRWFELKYLERAGAISDLRRQVPFELQSGFRYNGVSYRPIRWVVDFAYNKDGMPCVEDFKQPKTASEATFRLKLRMFLYQYGATYNVFISQKSRGRITVARV